MASLTINLSREVLQALAQSRPIQIAVGGGGGKERAPRAAATGQASRRGRGRTGGKAAGRPRGQPPGQWASGRKRPFGADDVMNALKVKRGHAGMLLTGAVRSGALRREGRGEYSGRR